MQMYKAYDEPITFICNERCRQDSPDGEFLLTGQNTRPERRRAPKATRDSDFPGTLNGAGSEKNLAQHGFDAAVDEQSGTFVGLLSTRFGG